MKKTFFCAAALMCLSMVSYAQNGVINTFAGTGASGFSGDGGQAILATIDSPSSITMDRLGNVYVIAGCRVRKINPAGVISTVAGNGVQTYAGDGGPAISASLRQTSGMTVDSAGNIYVCDLFRLRKINTSGIITTIAGTGAHGSSGDGGPATAAKVDPTGVAVDASGNIYIADFSNSRIRMINTSGIISTVASVGANDIAIDSAGNIFFADFYGQRVGKINTSGVVSTIAGTGTAGTSGDGKLAILAQLNYPRKLSVDKSGNIYVEESYRIREITAIDGKINTAVNAASGGFYGDGGYSYCVGINPADFALDTLGNLYVTDCSHNRVRKIKRLATVDLYIDMNNNCTFNDSEPNILKPFVIQVDSNNIVIDTISATSTLNYYVSGNAGDIYTFKTLTIPGEIINSCPVSGIITDTVISNENIYKGSMGFKCITALGLDLDVKMTTRTGHHAQTGNIYVSNNNCTPSNATVTLNFSPKFIYHSAVPVPTSVSSNAITWDITSVSTVSPVKLFFWLEKSGADLIIGDTVHAEVSVTPTIGDSNPLNNSMIIIDTARSGYDPNEMSVSPSGYIPPGVVTNLEYTIQFENTGNDTAFNIYVIDSLSDYVDPKSFRIVSASAKMNTTMLHSGVHNILKFDFPNINLLDSSHHGECDGMVKFTINTRNGLPWGTTILNHAGIYFDSNPVVMTNTVEDIIGFPAKVSVLNNTDRVQVFPNPANNTLNVSASEKINSITINNLLGQAVYTHGYSVENAQVDVSMLPAGVYFIKINSGAAGISVTKKFVKE